MIAALGFAALAVATDFNLLTAGTLDAFLRFLALPIVIGLAQMVVLAVGQMNLRWACSPGSARSPRAG